MARAAQLQQVVDGVAAELRRVTGPGAGLAQVALARLDSVGTASAEPAERLPVCDHIASALALAAEGARRTLAAAFGRLDGQLSWRRRGSAQPGDEPFYSGHANAELLGPRGLEVRSDLWLGATIMPPDMLYPNHSHPPEELYIPLSPGEWWNARMDWTDPGPGGFIYNPPGILHAMRSGRTPFLALWVLPL